MAAHKTLVKTGRVRQDEKRVGTSTGWTYVRAFIMEGLTNKEFFFKGVKTKKAIFQSN
jgi:hypothetical protein